MKNNPFNLTFGKKPGQMISRFVQTSEIMDSFTADEPSQQIYMITGVRGCGKTVFMNSIARDLESDEDWIVIELNSSSDMMREFAAKLYESKGMSGKFRTAGINLSFWGIGINIKKADPITDLGTAIERMLEHISKYNRRVLVTIDEVSNSKQMKEFAGAFQILVRHDLPLFLLMTGLYENINRLQNEDNLTFLYRAPKIFLPSLSISRISEVYKRIFGLSQDASTELARISKGYPFAFQVIGYFTFDHNGDYETALPDIRQYLNEYVYDKIWMELSDNEKKIIGEIGLSNITDVKTIKENLGMKPNEFSVYRDRLIKKGVLNGNGRGQLVFALPYFSEYLKEHTFT